MLRPGMELNALLGPVPVVQHLAVGAHLMHSLQIDRRIDPARLVERASGDDAVIRKAAIRWPVDASGPDIDVDGRRPIERAHQRRQQHVALRFERARRCRDADAVIAGRRVGA